MGGVALAQCAMVNDQCTIKILELGGLRHTCADEKYLNIFIKYICSSNSCFSTSGSCVHK